MDFFIVFRVFNFLCLFLKGFFIDKVFGFVGSAVEEKLLMERLAIRDMQGLVCWEDGFDEVVGEFNLVWVRGRGVLNG